MADPPEKGIHSRKQSELVNKSIATQSTRISKHKRTDTKGSLVTNDKPGFLKETKGSKIKKQHAIQKTKSHRSNSRGTNLVQSKPKVVKKESKKIEHPDIDNLVLLADEFWDNVEQQKQTVPKHKVEKSSGVKRITKPVLRERTPVAERTTFTTRMKAQTARGTKTNSINQNLHDKFKKSKVFNPVRSKKSNSRGRQTPRRVISTPRDIGIKSNLPLMASKSHKNRDDAAYYSPIQREPKPSSALINEINTYSDHNFDFGTVEAAKNEILENKQPVENPDSTLQLTIDEKEIQPRAQSRAGGR